ncbi:MAG: MFS transporter [Bradyrhizobium sp.]|nr:MFS transporter [Bradyrhizobium sp.]
MHAHVTAGPDLIGLRLDASPLRPVHWRALGLLGAAHMLDAYDATALAFVLPILITSWELQPVQIGILLAGGYLGQLAGAIMSGMLAERFGRIAVLRATLAILSTFSVACAWSPGFWWLFGLRLVQGVGLGGETPVGASYLNELMPARVRGRMVSFIQWMFAIGTLIGAFLAPILVPGFGWQALFVVGGLPILLAAVLQRALPESARWLAANGRMEEAGRVAAQITGTDVPPTRGHARRTAAALPRPALRSLFTEGRAKSTLGAWCIGFCASLVGYGLIGWMPTFYRTVYHLPMQEALRYGASNGIAALIGGSIGVLLIDRMRRKTYLALGFGGSALAIAVLVWLGPAARPIEAALLSGTALTLLGMPLSGFYVYVPELYPTQLRAFGVGVASAWLRVASIAGPPLVGFMLTLWTVDKVFLLFAVTAAGGSAATLILGRETR